MNGRIAGSLLVVFAIVFSFYFTLNAFFPMDNSDMLNDPFFSMEEDPENELAFLMGNSAVVQLNSTRIDQNVSKNFEEYTVYNVAYNGDTPNIRILNIDKLSALKPKIIFYGLSYDTFILSGMEMNAIDKKNQSLLPDPGYAFGQLIEKNNQEYGPFNPKITILKAIRSTLDFTGLFPPTTANKIYLENAPFSYFAEYQRKIYIDPDNLYRYTGIEEIKEMQVPIENNNKIENFRKIIEKLQESNIKVVLFITPLHENFISNVEESEKRKLYDIVNKSAKDFNLDVYDFHDKYAEFPIWMDVTHIAYHKDSMIYSDDVAEMIILELNKIKT